MKTKFNITNLPTETFISVGVIKINVIEAAVRRHINKKFTKNEIEEIHKNLNIKIDICNMCEEEFVPYRYILDIQDNDIRIIGVNCKIKPNIFCYGKNKVCKERTRLGKMNPNSAEFISIVRKISIDEAKTWIRQNNKSTFYKENYVSDDDYKKSQSRDLNWHIKKYGEELGKQKYEKVIEKQNYARSISGFIEKYGEELGKQKYEKYCCEKDSMSLSSFERVHPNLSKKERSELCKQRRKSVGLTREKFIEKHGAEKFYDMQRKRQIRSYHGVSLWSLRIIGKIIDFLENSQIQNINEIKFGECNEYLIFDNENLRSYAYDFYVEINNKKKIVEFNGRAFHSPPNLTQEQKEEWRGVFSKRTWKESFDFDQRKIKIANDFGIETLIVWDFESDNDILEKIKVFLND